MHKLYETYAKRMKKEGAKVSGKTPDPAASCNTCPETQAGSARPRVACRVSVGPGGLDPLEGQRSGWIVCRRSHYHAGLWPTPSNEYLVKFYKIPRKSIGILGKSIGILWTSIGILWISIGTLWKSIRIQRNFIKILWTSMNIYENLWKP